MSTVIIYTSQDSSAPVLTGQVGTLVALLDACLVNGYGSKSAAGWAKSFTGTNKAAYRNSATDGTGYYLNVDDSGGGGGGAREAFMTGFQTMSALATGTNQFPSSSQLNLGTAPAGAVVARKSNTADSTARKWTVVADNTVFYLFMETGDQTNPVGATVFFFGDFFSYGGTADVNRCMIIGRNDVNTSNGQPEWTPFLNGISSTADFQNSLLNTLPGHFMAGSYTGVGGSLQFGKHSDNTKMGLRCTANATGTASNFAIVSGLVGGYGANSSQQNSLFLFPNPEDGGLYLAPIWLHHGGTLRGYFKGLWTTLAQSPYVHNDTFSGSGSLSGKTFIAQNNATNVFTTAGIAQWSVETSTTWN